MTYTQGQSRCIAPGMTLAQLLDMIPNGANKQVPDMSCGDKFHQSFC